MLTVLSTIGIIVLIILGVIIVLAALLLFYPFLYRVKIEKKEEFLVRADIFWLLWLVHIIVTFKDGMLEWDLRVFGLPVKRMLKSIDNRKKARLSRKRKRPPTIMPGQKPDKKVLENARRAAKAEMKNKEKQKKQKKFRIPDLDDIIEAYENMPGPVEAIENFFRSLPGRIKRFINIVSAYIAIKPRIFALIRHIMPKKAKGYLAYGFDDPSLTGKSFGWICMFYPVLPRGLSIIPDFTKAFFECDLLLKGRIILIYLLVHGLKIYFNKEVKAVIRRKEGGK